MRALSGIKQNQGGTRALCAAELGGQEGDTAEACADDSFTFTPPGSQPSPASPMSDMSPELPTGQRSSPPGEGLDCSWIYNTEAHKADPPLPLPQRSPSTS